LRCSEGMGQLWRPTSKAYESLFGVNINTDKFFMLQYDKQTDERSARRSVWEPEINHHLQNCQIR